jgi:EmrB/QacA subfamily drug resistance transporter
MATFKDLRQTEKYKRRWWTLAIITLTVVAIGLDQMILNIALPTLQRELSANSSQLIWMVDAYIVVFAVLLLPAGRLGDRFGRAKALQLGVIIFGLSSLAAAYAGSVSQLIAARAVMGISGALIMTSTLSVVTDVFPREERGRAIGVWAGVSAMGLFLGPVIGGVLLEHFWWGSVFLINVPIAAVALLLGLFLVPDSKDPGEPKIDLVGSLLSIGAIGLLVYGIIEAPSRGWTDTVVLVTLIGSLPLAIAFVIWELNTSQPLVDFKVFKNPRFAGGATGNSLASFARMGAGFGLTQFLQFVQGYSPLQAGIRILPLVLGIAVGSSLSDRLVSRFGSNKVIAGGMVVLAAGLAAFVLWLPDTAYWAIAVNMFILAVAVGNIMAPSTDAVMGAVSEAQSGMASAVNGVTRMIAGALGAAIIGSAMYTIYADKVASAVSGLPAELAGAAQDSVGAAMVIAESLPSEAGDPLAQAAGAAFTESFGLAILIGCAVTLVGALLVALYLPPKHLAPEVVSEDESYTAVESTSGPAPAHAQR